jgi:beta-phosphoglucomutase-like phosphatase (HAD superfamily)
MPIEAVLWDIDGTMVDSEPAHNRALIDALAAWNIHPSPEMQRRVIGAAMDETHAMLASAHPGLPDLDSFIAAKLRAYLRRSGELRLRTGAEDAWRLAGRRQLRRALVSNSDRIVVDANIRAVGLAQPGLVSISRNDVRKGKPDSEPYLRAAHLLRVTPETCIVVEDSPVGVQAGLAAGMRVIVWPEASGSDARFPLGAVPADPHYLATTLRRLIDR